jgi:threonine dehydratase
MSFAMTPPVQSRLRPGAFIAHEMLGKLKVPGYADVLEAADRLQGRVRRTPLLWSARLDAIAGGRVWLKAENLQVTGSFKIRGAFNALLGLSTEQRSRGVVAYSTGNHGQAIAWASRQLGVKATIVMPADAPLVKVEKALSQGARVEHYDRRTQSRETIGMRLLAETGGTLIPPGDHPAVIAGQATVALEAIADLPDTARDSLEVLAAPCGGGGLIAGCGLVFDALSPATRLIAVEPEEFDDTRRSLLSGRREGNRADAATLCDALQAATPAELPFEINRHYVERAVAVDDAEVMAAMNFALEELHLLLEPGGAVALAAMLQGRIALGGGHALVVLSGGNVDRAVLQKCWAGA